MKHIYTSIDIGSDTIKIIVCELYKNKLNLLAASSVKSKGIKKGLITDVESASTSVKKAFGEIEDMLGIQIKKVIAIVPSYFSEFAMIKGEIEVHSEDNVITGEEIIEVLEQVMNSKKNPNKEMVTVVPIHFAVDGKEGIKDPKGMTGNKLETKAIMATTPKKNVYSVVSLLENMGIEVIDISLSSIGDIYAFKNKKMEEQVGAIINIGSETTTVAIYNKGIIVKNSVIGYGGDSITSDLSYMYHLPLSVARNIKEKFAFAHKKYASSNDFYEADTTEGEKVRINQYEVSSVAMSRIEEILTLAKEEIRVMTDKKMDSIIVTGGTTNMAHFEYLVHDVFGKNASVGSVKLLGIRNNKYSSAVGNIVYFINKLKLKEKEYTMVTNNDMEMLSSTKQNLINISNESMLGKVFGYFFGE